MKSKKERKKKSKGLRGRQLTVRWGIAVGKGSKTRAETEERVCNQLVLLCVLK